MPRERALFVLCLVTLLASLLITLDVVFGGALVRLDAWIEPQFLPPMATTTTRFARGIGDAANVFLSGAAALLTASVVSRYSDDRRALARTLIALGSVGVAVYVLKGLVGRETVWQLAGGSYPSGHAAIAVVTAWTIAAASFRRRRRALLWTVLAATTWGGIVAWSRVIIAAHWTTDALAGVTLGLAIASGATLLLSPPSAADGVPRESPRPARVGRR